MPSRDLFLRLGVHVVLIGGGVLAISSVPTLSVGGYTVPTGFAVGVLGGLCLLPATVSHYREGEQRESLQWGLFAIGVPLSLIKGSVLSWIGLLAILGSLGVGWRHHQPETVPLREASAPLDRSDNALILNTDSEDDEEETRREEQSRQEQERESDHDREKDDKSADEHRERRSTDTASDQVGRERGQL